MIYFGKILQLRNSFVIYFGKILQLRNMFQLAKLFFFQAEISFESKGYPLTKEKFRKDALSRKKWNEVFSTIKRKLIDCTLSNVTKRSPSRLRKLIFFREILETKNFEKCFSEIVFEKSPEKFSLLGKSHNAEKNEKWPAIAE